MNKVKGLPNSTIEINELVGTVQYQTDKLMKAATRAVRYDLCNQVERLLNSNNGNNILIISIAYHPQVKLVCSNGEVEKILNRIEETNKLHLPDGEIIDGDIIKNINLITRSMLEKELERELKRLEKGW
ncbi:hypothetical protein [uncultured Staphylococcus sp.]|uniref:hypothetical protein n=1 Tax=uncultured Staphylococcus sp. TaxID=189668 RepID=UPI0025DE001C|nr:hypothetical protein [uncultured Staphylococcus sp.]